MGNTPIPKFKQSTDYGSIEIVLTQPYYITNENVTGKVILTIKKEYLMSKIVVRLIGKENTILYSKANTILLIDQILTLEEAQPNEPGRFGGKPIEPGTREYSFSFKIGDLKKQSRLPSSVSFKNEQFSCDVNYYVEGLLESPKNAILGIGTSKKICILENLLIENNKKLSRTFDIADGKNRYGNAKFQVEIDCTGIIASLGFEIMVGYDNRECKKSVRKIKVKVMEKAAIKPKGKSKEFMHEKLVGKWKLPGIPKDESRFYCNRLEFTKDSITKLETSEGNSFYRSYKLIVEAIYDSWKNNPKIQCDVNITRHYKSTNPNNPLRNQEEEEEKKEEIKEEEALPVEIPQADQNIVQAQPALQPGISQLQRVDEQAILSEVQQVIPELQQFMPIAQAIIPEQLPSMPVNLQSIAPQVMEENSFPPDNLVLLQPLIFPIDQPPVEDGKQLMNNLGLAPLLMVNSYNQGRDNEGLNEEMKVPVPADSYEPIRYSKENLEQNGNLPILAPLNLDEMLRNGKNINLDNEEIVNLDPFIP